MVGRRATVSRRRIQLEGSLPCDPLLLLEAMAELFSYKSEEEHIRFMKENNITGSFQWSKYYKNNRLTEKNYYSNPWKMFNKTIKQFFEEIYGKSKTEEEYIKIIKKNDITGGYTWRKYWKDNNLKKRDYLCSPWLSFDKTTKQFFEDIYGEKIYRSEQEHTDIIKKNNITKSDTWRKYWKNNNLKEQGYLSQPWDFFGKTCEDLFGRKKTEQEHIQFMKENNLISFLKWSKYWRDNNLVKQKYLHTPWRVFSKTQKQFFSQVN